MKSKILSVLAKLFFVLAAIQAAWLILAALLSPGQPISNSSPGTVTITEPGHGVASVAFQIAPFLFLVLLAGLGFCLRWLSKRLVIR
jgi:cytosine/uracil/thiamine/allantoin permease